MQKAHVDSSACDPRAGASGPRSIRGNVGRDGSAIDEGTQDFSGLSARQDLVPGLICVGADALVTGSLFPTLTVFDAL
jgi:hypothetical protein